MDTVNEEISQLALSYTQLLAIQISLEDYVIKIVLTIDLQLRDNQLLELHFDGVRKYSFYKTSDYSGYYIVDYNFFMTDNLYYISLDPVDISDTPSEEDNDFIYAEKVTIRHIKKG